MRIVCFDPTAVRTHLLPLTYTRPVADIRVGISTIAEKWAGYTAAPVSFLTVDYLSEKFPSELSGDDVFIDGSVLPDQMLADLVCQLEKGEALSDENGLIACRCDNPNPKAWHTLPVKNITAVQRIDRLWKIFRYNGDQIRSDFSRITRGRTSDPLTDPHTHVYGAGQIFISPGAKVQAAVIHAGYGPVFLGPDSEVQEGALIRGPFALCEGSVLAMGAVVRGDTTIGPFSKAGGELNNVVFHSWSNKGHEGYLGNAVIGAYCNLGAGTHASNLRNDFGNARQWNYAVRAFESVDSPFCGPVIADGCRTAIGTTLNTATSVGPGVNLFGSGFPRTFIPPMVEGGAQGLSERQPQDVTRSIENQMALKGKSMPDADKNIWREVFARSAEFRNWAR